MTRECSGCGLMRCEGECYFTEAEPEEPSCHICDQPWPEDNYCRNCEHTREEAEAFEAERLTRQIERELRFLKDRAA